METTGSLCPRCNEVEVEVFNLAGTLVPSICDLCNDAIEQEREAETKAKQGREREILIEAQIPPLYRSNDVSLFPPSWSKISHWRPNQGQGMLLVGDTGKSKTRMLCQRVMDLHRETGIRFEFLRSSLLGKLVRQQFGDFEPWVARNRIDALGRVPLLIIDDLGKQASSPVVEEEFFDLIEERTSQKLPTLFTANAKSDELEKMMSPDRGRPLIRRIKEFCDVHVIR